MSSFRGGENYIYLCGNSNLFQRIPDQALKGQLFDQLQSLEEALTQRLWFELGFTVGANSRTLGSIPPANEGC